MGNRLSYPSAHGHAGAEFRDKVNVIDNVEALDFNNLIALSGLIEKEEFKNSYDHVFIGGVNHEDVVGAFNMENSDDSILSV